MISCSLNTCQVTCTCTLTCSGDLTALNDGAVTEKPATGIQQVIDKARHDPSFFGTLRTDPDTALSGLALTPAERAAISANTPEKLLSLVIGTEVAGAGCDQTCGYTCANTCSGGYTMSCGGTCNYTCDYTAGIQLWVGNRPT